MQKSFNGIQMPEEGMMHRVKILYLPDLFHKYNQSRTMRMQNLKLAACSYKPGSGRFNIQLVSHQGKESFASPFIIFPTFIGEFYHNCVIGMAYFDQP